MKFRLISILLFCVLASPSAFAGLKDPYVCTADGGCKADVIFNYGQRELTKTLKKSEPKEKPVLYFIHTKDCPLCEKTNEHINASLAKLKETYEVRSLSFDDPKTSQEAQIFYSQFEEEANGHVPMLLIRTKEGRGNVINSTQIGKFKDGSDLLKSVQAASETKPLPLSFEGREPKAFKTKHGSIESILELKECKEIADDLKKLYESLKQAKNSKTYVPYYQSPLAKGEKMNGRHQCGIEVEKLLFYQDLVDAKIPASDCAKFYRGGLANSARFCRHFKKEQTPGDGSGCLRYPYPQPDKTDKKLDSCYNAGFYANYTESCEASYESFHKKASASDKNAKSVPAQSEQKPATKDVNAKPAGEKE